MAWFTSDCNQLFIDLAPNNNKEWFDAHRKNYENFVKKPFLQFVTEVMDAIRTIAAGAAAHLAPGGWLLLEHHHDQSEAVLALLNGTGLEQVSPHRDLEGIWRFASGQRPGATP